MKTIVSIGGRLAVICAVPPWPGIREQDHRTAIAVYKQAQLEEALSAVVPSVRQGKRRMSLTTCREDPLPIVGAEGGDGAAVGYVLKLVGVGYGGDIVLIASYAPDGTVMAARLMDNSETPGLGKAAENRLIWRSTSGQEATEPFRPRIPAVAG
jgi:electron transport complex protein RnfG